MFYSRAFSRAQTYSMVGREPKLINDILLIAPFVLKIYDV